MRYEEIYETLKHICIEQFNTENKVKGMSTKKLAKFLNMHRTNVSRELARMVTDGKIQKKQGRPVLYYIDEKTWSVEKNNKIQYMKNFEKQTQSIIDTIIGKDYSLKHPIALAKAAIVYPPRGLHTLILGDTGVGKSYFAKCMYKYALEINRIKEGRFVVFNCADYANNPQLLISHLFGVKKGAYTGANEDRHGIIEKGREGIIFLDEVHRLPPQGQEMLFTLIDEGVYVPLGGTKEVKINVMIICATTENIDSVLLKTFTRRIPVTISLPDIKHRTGEERYSLIKRFIKDEEVRINKEIEIDEDVLTALLNYECPNNIGQLKSDIQIASAKAFLKNMFKEEKVKIKLEDFSNEIRSGLLISKKINPMDLKIKTGDIKNTIIEEDVSDKYSLSKNIYEFIEKRTEYLTNKGFEQKDIKNRLVNEVGNFINEYLSNMQTEHKEDDIKKIVNSELYDFLSSFIQLAQYKLKRKITRNTFLGLLVHIDTFLGRIKENRSVENPKVDEIRKKYPKEFNLAMLLADKLGEKYKITVPIGEIAFIAMFFSVDNQKVKAKVNIIVAMHGNSAATSIAEVSNNLLNVNHAIGFDMPLSMKPETALCKLEEIIKEKHEGKGILLLVDMGSLKFFGEMISENTGIEIKTIDMVSTATVIEATRKAVIYQSLDEIIEAVNLESRYLGEFIDKPVENKKKNIIITACSTGEGTAQKLKEIIKEKYSDKNYEVINLSINDKKKFKKAVENIEKDKNISFIISAFDPEIKDIKHITMENFFKEVMGEEFHEFINDEEIVKGVKVVYKEYLNLEENDFLVDEFIKSLSTMKCIYGIHLDRDKLNGLLMHFGCLVEKLLNREETPKCKTLQLITSRYCELFNYLKESLQIIEFRLQIKFTDHDIANIVEILVNI
ncbi:sigma-54-dependent transcriptional regulator [Clostridium ganghwense]|uniref:Sigma 54-interacting transcriptional regulator n=1 Tax=Clostridium ganghwense TaxID=312089 RepID=A0ABT4CS53_9CLOT|nr:sigma-54-dependent transcriptional regulator [Clostridium ganghwense]MCY6371877.1 sigma 54-interacting transcriptional regulator [Clostridium ganghwense]